MSLYPYYKFAKENIFEPLGMHNTLVFDESKPFMANRATGHTKNGEINDYEILTVGDGGMYSTVEAWQAFEHSSNEI